MQQTKICIPQLGHDSKINLIKKHSVRPSLVFWNSCYHITEIMKYSDKQDIKQSLKEIKMQGHSHELNVRIHLQQNFIHYTKHI